MYCVNMPNGWIQILFHVSELFTLTLMNICRLLYLLLLTNVQKRQNTKSCVHRHLDTTLCQTENVEHGTKCEPSFCDLVGKLGLNKA